ncbi:MAG TPA: hypothetical protein VGB67_05390, partial [Fibrella sp.]
TYWTGTFQTSTQLTPGSPINTTTTIYVVEETATTPNCFASSPLTITIVDSPELDVYDDVTMCDQYVLPDLPAGVTYQTQAGGLGTTIAEGTVITATTTIHVYAQTGTTPNCTDQDSFVVTINNTPGQPVVQDVTVCDSYILPVLPPGSTYHTGANGTGTQLAAGYEVTTTQTICVYAQTGTTPNCTSQACFTVTVNNTPQVDDLADVEVCTSYTLPDLVVGGNYYDGPNGTGNPYFADDVIESSMTMYIYEATGTNPNCTSETSFEITIHELPVIVSPTPLALCDDNADGIMCFNLTTKNNEITGGNPDYVVSYHETPDDAISGANPLNATNYCNIEQGMESVYIRVTPSGAPQCYSTTSMVLIVNPRPVVPVSVADFAKCDYTNTGDGIEVFNLTQMNNVLLGGQTNIAITYYESSSDAETEINPITNPTAYSNITSPLQQICARLENTNTLCYSVVCFNLRVDALPVITDPAPMQMCNDGVTNEADFDLAGNDAVITNNVDGLQVSYHLTLADAQNEVGALASPYTSGPRTLFVRVENVSTNCYVTTTLTLNVNQGPVVVTPTPLEMCDPNNDGFVEFDLHSKDIEISGGEPQAGVVITYHETAADAQNGVNALPYAPMTLYPNNDPWTETLYVRVAFEFTGCTAFTELQLIVHPTPEANEDATALEACDDNADGYTCFNLNNATSDILNGIDPATHTVTYHVLQENAQDGTNAIVNLTCFTNTDVNGQTIYVRVEHNTTGCFDVVSLELIVNPLPVVAFPIPSYTLCDLNPGAQTEVFDLASQIPTIIGTQADMEVTFHFSAAQAEAGTDDLPLSYTAGPVQTIHVRVTNTETGCYETSTMDLRVEPLPAPVHPLPEDPLLNLCDLNGDGFATFNLQGLVAPMQQGTSSFTVTFHETEASAQNDTAAIPNPSAYDNNQPYMQIVWVRAENTGSPGCSVTFPIVLNVVAAPVIAADSVEDLSQCDTNGNNQDGYSVFNLTVQNADLLAQQTGPSTSYVISYYTTAGAAALGTGRILNPSGYTNTTAFSQEIWIRIEDVGSECVAIDSFMINVDIPLALTSQASYPMCDDNPNDNGTPSATFDLTIRDAQITQNQPGYTVAYFLTSADQIANTNAIQNPQAFFVGQNALTIYVAVTSPSAGCRSFTTLTLRVIPLPTPITDLA